MMKKEKDVLEKYEHEKYFAAALFSEDITVWKYRRDSFRALYAIGWILGKTEEEIDEDLSETINHEWKLLRKMWLKRVC